MSELKRKQPQKSQRRQMVQGVQREYLFEAMKDLLSKNKKEVHKKQIWENIANELNKLGPVKEPARWRKCWSDLLLRLRKRILQQQDKFQVPSLNDQNSYKNLKLSPDDIKILNCYGGIDLLFKDCNRKTKDGRIETISISDSTDNDNFIYDNQDDTQMTYPFNNNAEYYESSTPVTAKKTTNHIKIDIPEIYENNNKIINNHNEEIFKNSRIIDDQMIVESINKNNINNNNNNNKKNNINNVMINHINQESSSSTNNEIIQTSVSVVDHIKESLEIQKQTFEEIRRLGVIQQETNNLIRILINRLTSSAVDGNTNNETENVNHVPEESHLSMLSVKLEEINHNETI